MYFFKYCYHKPICFQLLNDTENRRKGWIKFLFLKDIIIYLTEYVELHKNNKNYTKIFNLINTIVFIIIMLLVILGANSIKKFL